MNSLLSQNSKTLLIVLFLLLSSTLFSKNIAFTQEEELWMKEHPVITYSETNWEPMSIIKNSTMVGVMSEYLKKISQESGLVFKYKQASSWPDVIQMFKNREIDIIPGIGASDFESKLGLTSKIYADFPFVLVTKTSESFINHIDEIEDKIIAVPEYWTSYNYLKEQKPNIKIIATKDAFEALNLVKSGKAYAFLGHQAIGMYYVGVYYPHTLHIAGKVEYKFNHMILLQKSDTILLGIINKIFDSMSEKEQLDIKEKWLRVQVKEAEDYTLLYQITAVFVLLILGTLYWNRKLSDEIYERKLLESSLKQSEEQMRTLINNIPLHVIVSTYSGEVLLANPKSLQDYNYTEADLPHLNLLDYYEKSSEREEMLQELKTYGKVEEKVMHFVKPDGVYQMMLSVLPIKYDKKDALLSIGVDITERLKMEAALVKAKNSAESANRSKSEFLANMSHEIRTPMNAILGFTELLNEQITEPRLKSYTQTIKNSSNTLLTLINDILDLSKIEAGKLLIQKTPTNILHLSHEISSIFMIGVQKKNLDFILEVDKSIPQSLLLDEVRIRQVLLNLIGNSVKFTQHGFIKLAIKSFNVDEHHSKLDLELSVEDSGIGIPNAELEKIFEEFEQKEGQDSRKFGGTGLGLAISKRLCEMMGGHISVKSQEQKGTTFTVHLYNIDISSIVQEKILHDNLEQESKNIIFKKAKVLVVDDIKDNRELIIKNFEDTAIEIVTANDGLEAIATFKKENPDLILMDIRMPNMNGYEAALEIKKIANIPIIALTASVMQDDYERSKREHFDGFLRKPVLKYNLYLELSHFLAHDTQESDVSKDDEFILSDKAQLNIALIVNLIESKVITLIAQAKKSNNIADMKILASKIALIASDYEVDILDKYASQLYEAIDVFDIAKLEQLLDDFDAIYNRLLR